MSTILLLEDDAMIASGLVYALEMEGYEVFHAAKVSDAMKMISNSPDLAILDMQLPDGNGFDVSRPLKEQGVPLALSIIRGQGGDIDIESEGRNKGSTFGIKLFK